MQSVEMSLLEVDHPDDAVASIVAVAQQAALDIVVGTVDRSVDSPTDRPLDRTWRARPRLAALATRPVFLALAGTATCILIARGTGMYASAHSVAAWASIAFVARVAAIGCIAWTAAYLSVRGAALLNTSYELSDDLLVLHTGVFRRRERHIPLRMVVDATVDTARWERVFGCGTVIVHSRDRRAPLARLVGVTTTGAIAEDVLDRATAARKAADAVFMLD